MKKYLVLYVDQTGDANSGTNGIVASHSRSS